MTQRYLTVREAADYLGKTRKAIYHMIYRRQLVPIYVTPQSIRIDKEAIDKSMTLRTH